MEYNIIIAYLVNWYNIYLCLLKGPFCVYVTYKYEDNRGKFRVLSRLYYIENGNENENITENITGR